MTVNIPTHFVQQYTTNVAFLLQKKGGKLRSTVTEATYQGESAVAVDQYGSAEMLEVVGRFSPMPRVDINTDRRWVFPTDFNYPQMCDTFDKLRLMVDPMSSLAKSAVFAAGRRTDNTIFDAFFADAKTGKAGGTTTSFDTATYRVAASFGAAADTGLNVDKLLRAKRILQDANVDLDEEEPYIAITPQQEEDLLRQTQVINTDYFTQIGGAPVLVDGRIRRFAGINFIISNLVQTNTAGTYTNVPVWVKSGMHLGLWQDVQARVDTRPDIEGVPYQLATTLTLGATRLEEGRVVQIQCA